jgi:hypothetical protein
MLEVTCEITLDSPISMSEYIVSASNREFDFTRSSHEFLISRFKKNKYKFLFPWSFAKLPSIYAVQPIGGSAYFCIADVKKLEFKVMGQLKIGYDKIQYCKVIGDSLWVLGVSTLAAFKIKDIKTGSEQTLMPEIFIQDSFLAGGHIFHVEKESIYVSSSGCEGVLVFNTTNGKLLRKYLFKGHKLSRSYSLSGKLDLRKNYIGNDFQKFHLNSCTKHNEKIFFTTLSGLVGYFHVDSGKSKVIAEGYTGLHSINYNPTNGHLHFTQSTTGTFFCMNVDGKVLRSGQIDSIWAQSAISWEDCNQIIFLDTFNNQIVLSDNSGFEGRLKAFSLENLDIGGPIFISKVLV